MSGKANGKLLHEHLDSLWNYKDDKGNGPYARKDYDTFLRLMYRFELSYELPRRAPSAPQATLVPHHLPIQSPTGAPQPPIDDTPCVRMVYRFGFLPTALMGRIIVRTHHDICQDFQWRNGVVLDRDNHFARIELGEDFGQDICTLTVWGVYPHNFFTMLIGIIDSILSDYKGMEKNLERRIPCPTSGCLGAFRVYQPGSQATETQSTPDRLECDKCDTSYSLRELLEGIHSSSAPRYCRYMSGDSPSSSPHRKAKSHIGTTDRTDGPADHLRWLIAPWNQADTACPTLFKLYPTKPGGWREMLGTESRSPTPVSEPGASVHWQGKSYRYRFDCLVVAKSLPNPLNGSQSIKVRACPSALGD